MTLFEIEKLHLKVCKSWLYYILLLHKCYYRTLICKLNYKTSCCCCIFIWQLSYFANCCHFCVSKIIKIYNSPGNINFVDLTEKTSSKEPDIRGRNKIHTNMDLIFTIICCFKQGMNSLRCFLWKLLSKLKRNIAHLVCLRVSKKTYFAN